MRRCGAALLHTLSFAIALFVQRMDDWAAAAWIFFFFAGCALLVFDGRRYKFDSFLRVANLLWLIAIGVVVFLFNRVYGVTPVIWILAAMPLLALCLRKEYLKFYLAGFGAVITAFAVALIVQWTFRIWPPEGIRYTWVFDPTHPAAAWPMVDPNNAAMVLNCALIPCFSLALRKAKWFLLWAIFVAALILTGSKAGIAVAAAACLYVTLRIIGSRWWVKAAYAACAICAALSWLLISVAFVTRFPIWSAAVSLLDIHPFTGLGVGTFGAYYAHIRTEHYSAGFFAHNDVLQIAVEMGIPAAFVFSLQWVIVALETCRANIVSGAALFALLAQSMVEFQFYVPAVSLLAGLAFAWHTYHNEDATYEATGKHLSGG